MANKLEVVLSVVEEGFDNFKKAIADFDSLTRKTIVLNQAFEATKNVAGLVKGVFDKLYGSASNIAEAVDKQSQILNISTTEMQRWNFVANQNKASTETVTNAFTKLLTTQYESVVGNKAAAKAFDDLGVNVKTATGELKSSDEIINDTMGALAGIENESRRAALAQDLFGKAGKELLPVLSQGKDAIDAQKKSAEELGQVMSERAVKNITAMNDAMDRMKTSLSVAGGELVTAFLPALEKLVDLTAKAASGISKAISSDPKELDDINKKISAKYKELREIEDMGLLDNDERLNKISEEIDVLNAKRNALIALAKISKEGRGSGTEPKTGVYTQPVAGDEKADKRAMKGLNAAYTSDYDKLGEEAKARFQIEQHQAKSRLEAQEEINKEILANQKKTNAEKVKNDAAANASLKMGMANLLTEDKKIAEQKRQMYIANSREQLSVLTNVLQEAASRSKAAAVAYKTLAIATTIIDTYSGAQKAFNSLASIPYVGYALGLIAAGATVAAGMMRVNEIRKQQFASGGVSAGGMARVGEMGPEDVYLPAGSQVINHHNTQQMINNKTRNVSLNVTVMGDRGNVSQQFVRELRDSSADYAVKQLYAKMRSLGYASA